MRLRTTTVTLLAAAVLAAGCGGDDRETTPTSAAPGGAGATTAAPSTADGGLAGYVAACRAGDEVACDVAYAISPVDSEEEAIGGSCAGRGETFCSGYDPETSTASSYGDDPLLDELYDLCVADDNDACLALYLISPVDSEYEAVGLTGVDTGD